MQNIQLVYGRSEEELRQEKELIEQNVKSDILTCYVLSNDELELYQYIGYLHDDWAIKNKILYRLHICKQIILGDNVTYIPQDDDGQETNQPAKPRDMAELLKLLVLGQRAGIVFENNDRTLLANVLQQLIYIDYPITQLNLMLRSEFAQIVRTKKFMEHLDSLATSTAYAIEECKKSEMELAAEERWEDRGTMLTAVDLYTKIGEMIAKARNVEMKIAVAASKKTGKSVIVNCILRQEIAPTSLEMATPNTCIYRKSADDKFHICYEPISEDAEKKYIKQSFSTRDELFKLIRAEFKKAQDDKQRHFAIPDMLISYVSKYNNFDSYTIFDTPGPDAAGASHSDSAQRALKECDAAIFAIDYAKYLTTTEETYLKEIKGIFASQQKFHTLLFDINKMDLALDDKESISRVKSIDFIRKRLKDIDEVYKDCVIFATSAQDYFYTCELERYAREDARLLPLLRDDANWLSELRYIKNSIIDEDGDEELIQLLSNLDAETTRIGDQLGYRKINLESMHEYSGIPQILTYARYVMQSKARDEIVNSITYAISQQSEKLNSLINKRSNIIELMSKSQDEIESITLILRSYSEDVERILLPELTERDYKIVNEAYNDSSLDPNPYRFFISSLSRQLEEGKKFPIAMDNVLKRTVDSIRRQENDEIVEALWNDFSNRWKDRLTKLGCHIVERESIIPSDEMNTVCQNYVRAQLDEPIPSARQDISSVRDSLMRILTDRLELVGQRTEKCKEDLKKSGCELYMPLLPTWQVSIPDVPSNIEIQLPQFKETVLSLFEKEKLGPLMQWIRNIWDGKPGREEIFIPKMSKDLDGKLESCFHSFSIEIRKSGFFAQIETVYENLRKTVHAAGDEILSQFKIINEECKNNITIFKNAIDDREKFMADIHTYEQNLEIYKKIEQSSAGFLDVWNMVNESVETK